LTHYKITLRRSALSLGDRLKGTLEALGIHRRNQTVYHEHSSDIAGKILKVKELVEVENVPASAVRNKWEQRQERKAVRGYKVVGSRRDTFMNL
jgi:ribosomal protein L30